MHQNDHDYEAANDLLHMSARKLSFASPPDPSPTPKSTHHTHPKPCSDTPQSSQSQQNPNPKSPASTYPPSKRYKRLLNVIDKSLTEGASQVNTIDTVKQCYGEDADIFGEGDHSDGTEMLANLVTQVMERANEKLSVDVREIVEHHDVHKILSIWDSVVKEHESRVLREKQEEIVDKKTAREAVEVLRLPSQVTPKDVCDYQEYQVFRKARDELKADLESKEEKNEVLQKLMEDESKTLRGKVEVIQKTSHLLNQMVEQVSLEKTV